MTEKEYRASPGISRSELWLLNPRNGGSPEKFMFAKNNPVDATPAMIFGTLAHLALLEPLRFTEEFSFLPDGLDRRTKEGKAAWAEFMDNLGDRTPVSKDDWAVACQMAAEVNRFSHAQKLLSGHHEKDFHWEDDLTGEECKIRVDAIFDACGTPVIIDYKTTTDASTDAFARKAISLGYDFQAGMYCEGVEAVLGVKPRFVFIAQEKDAPYSVNVLEADEGFIQRGKDIFRELLGIYHECRVTGNWYGYMGPNATIGTLYAPAWALRE